MTNLEIQPVFAYLAGGDYGAEYIFHQIIEAALRRKYCPPIKVSKELLTDSVFSLSDHEEIEIFEQRINGKNIKELFCFLPVLKIVELKNEGKLIQLGFTVQASSVDLYLVISDPNSGTRIGHRIRFKPGEDIRYFSIQIKEDLDFDKRKLVDLARSYDELLVVFSRQSVTLTDKDLKDFTSFKHAWYVAMPDALEIVNKDGEVKKVEMTKDKYNFTAVNQDEVYHIKFSPPQSFIKVQSEPKIE